MKSTPEAHFCAKAQSLGNDDMGTSEIRFPLKDRDSPNISTLYPATLIVHILSLAGTFPLETRFIPAHPRSIPIIYWN